MKKKIFLFVFFLLMMSFVFTVSASASNLYKVYFLNPLNGRYDVFSVSQTFNLRYSIDNNRINVYIDGVKKTLTCDTYNTDMAVVNGIVKKDYRFSSGLLLPDVDYLQEQSVEFEGTAVNVFFTLTPELCGDYAGMVLESFTGSRSFGNAVLFFSAFGDNTYMFGGNPFEEDVFKYDDESGQSFLVHTDGTALTLSGDGAIYQKVLASFSSDYVDGVFFECENCTVVDGYGAYSFEVVNVPNNYNIYVATYDKTTEVWNRQRIVSASVLASATSYQLVDRNGVASFCLVNRAGTSYFDFPAFGLEDLCTFDDSLLVEGGFIDYGAMRYTSLPLNLLGLDDLAVDGGVVLYIGESVPPFSYLDDVSSVDATLDDLVQRMSDMIITVPILMLFIVLLPLISFGVGLLFRTKRT